MISKYNKINIVHKFYDVGINVISKYMYKHPRGAQLLLYKENMSKSLNHLEIGCASVYLPSNALNDKTKTTYYLLDIENLPLQKARQVTIQMIVKQFLN